MSVTAQPASRNAGERVYRGAGLVRLDGSSGAAWLCQRDADNLLLYGPHRHCAVCSVCLPPIVGRERGVRWDRIYCSNACRQRAYRRRQRERREAIDDVGREVGAE